MAGFKFMKTCNHYPARIFSHDGIDYFASDEDSAHTFPGDIIVNLTKSPGIKTISTVYKIPELSDHLYKFTDEIIIGWTDFCSPPVKNTFWSALHLYFKNKNYKQVLFHCQQGHGRTGTALAAMLISLQKKQASKAILKIRELHCKHSVESEKQILYLLLLDNELNGRLLPEEECDLEKIISDLISNKNTK